MGDHVEVVGGKKAGPALVLDNVDDLAGPLFLHQVVQPPAGLGAGAPVGAPPRHMVGEHAPPGIGHAHGPVDEGFQLDVFGQALPDPLDALQGQLPGQHDAPGAQLRPVQGPGQVHHVGLGADVQGKGRRGLPDHGKGPDVRHQGPVDAQGAGPPRRFGHPLKILVKGQQVQRQVKPGPPLMGQGQGLFQLFPGKVVRRSPEAVAFEPPVYGVRPKTQGGLQMLHPPCRGQKFHIVLIHDDPAALY